MYELDIMNSGFGDLQIDQIGFTTMNGLRTLFAFPVPGLFALTPLKTLTGFGPSAINFFKNQIFTYNGAEGFIIS